MTAALRRPQVNQEVQLLRWVLSVPVQRAVRGPRLPQREVPALPGVGSPQELLQDAAARPHQVTAAPRGEGRGRQRRSELRCCRGVPQEVLRGEDRHLLRLAGLLHHHAGAGRHRGPGMLHLRIQESGDQHLEVRAGGGARGGAGGSVSPSPFSA